MTKEHELECGCTFEGDGDNHVRCAMHPSAPLYKIRKMHGEKDRPVMTRPPLTDAQVIERLKELRDWHCHRMSQFAFLDSWGYHYVVEQRLESERIATIDAALQRLQPVPHRCSGCDLRWEDGAAVTLCGDCWRKAQSVVHTTSRAGVQDIAAIAWRCIKECADHQPPPVMCLKHQLEAEALLVAQPVVHQRPTGKMRVWRCACGFETSDTLDMSMHVDSCKKAPRPGHRSNEKRERK